MHIEIGKDYVVTSDTHNLILNERMVRGEKSKVAGEEYLNQVSYHTTLPDLVRALWERGVRKSEARSISELSDAITALYAEIMDAVPKMKTEFYMQNKGR